MGDKVGARVVCFDCGAEYGNPAWVEAVVADHIWNKYLSPTGDEGGILCIGCMAGRAARAGLSDVRVRLTAGPFTTKQVAARVSMPNWRSPVAIAMEAGTAETQSGSVHDSAGLKGIAETQSRNHPNDR